MAARTAPPVAALPLVHERIIRTCPVDARRGDLFDEEVLVRPAGDWDGSAQAGDPSWTVVRYEDLVVAVRSVWG